MERRKGLTRWKSEVVQRKKYTIWALSRNRGENRHSSFNAAILSNRVRVSVCWRTLRSRRRVPMFPECQTVGSSRTSRTSNVKRWSSPGRKMPWRACVPAVSFHSPWCQFAPIIATSHLADTRRTMCPPIHGVASSQSAVHTPILHCWTCLPEHGDILLQLAGAAGLDCWSAFYFSAPFSAWPGKGRWLPCALEPHPCEGRELLLRWGGGKCGRAVNN